MRLDFLKIFVAVSATLFAACASAPTTVSVQPIGKHDFPPKPTDHKIDVFLDDMKPEVPYDRIAIVSAEKRTFGVRSGKLEEVLDELKRQARGAGADGIINIVERQSKELENSSFFVTGVAVRYRDQSPD